MSNYERIFGSNYGIPDSLIPPRLWAANAAIQQARERVQRDLRYAERNDTERSLAKMQQTLERIERAIIKIIGEQYDSSR
jgi:hypothetical protein